MKTARILNLIAIIFCAVSLIIMVPILIYISIGFLVLSIIIWRISAGRKTRQEENPG
jgi:hypothetical protein